MLCSEGKSAYGRPTDVSAFGSGSPLHLPCYRIGSCAGGDAMKQVRARPWLILRELAVLVRARMRYRPMA